MERVYGSLMVGFARMSKSKVTQAVVNSVRPLYVKGAPYDKPTSPPLKQVHSFVDVNDATIGNLLSAGYSWVQTFLDPVGNRWTAGDYICILPAGKSVDPSCMFVVAGVMHRKQDDSNYLIARQIPVKPTALVRGVTGTGFVLPLAWDKLLGPQVSVKVDHLILDTVHICPVATYKNGNNPMFVIPFCGYVDFTICPHSTPATNHGAPVSSDVHANDDDDEFCNSNDFE